MKRLIVSRHTAAIQFVRENLPDFADAPALASVTADDLDASSHVDRRVYVAGNLPMHLASLCTSVHVVEFSGAAPRGTEYTIEEMRAAGARVAEYLVVRKRTRAEEIEAEARAREEHEKFLGTARVAAERPGPRPGDEGYKNRD